MEGHLRYNEAAKVLGRHFALHFLKTETLTHKSTHPFNYITSQKWHSLSFKKPREFPISRGFGRKVLTETERPELTQDESTAAPLRQLQARQQHEEEQSEPSPRGYQRAASRALGPTSFCSLGKMSWSSMLSKIHTGMMCAQLSKKSTIGSQFLGCHWATIFRTKGIQTSHISLREKDGAGWLNVLPGLTVRQVHRHPRLPSKENKGAAWKCSPRAISQSPHRPDLRLPLPCLPGRPPNPGPSFQAVPAYWQGCCRATPAHGPCTVSPPLNVSRVFPP